MLWIGLLLLTIVPAGNAQSGIELETGPYEIGYQTFLLEDTTRTFAVEGNKINRPIQVHLWYPSRKSVRNPVTLNDYVGFENSRPEKTESEREVNKLHRALYERIISWGAGREDLEAALKRNYLAVKDGAYHAGRFPLVIYAPSFNSTPFENIELLEHLAGRGYVVISSPSIGPQELEMEMDVPGFEAQMKDILFLLDFALTLENVDEDKVAAAGFSWGGGASVLAEIHDDRIDAVVDIDGSTRYPRGYSILSRSQYYEVQKSDKPYIYFESRLPQPDWGPFPDSTFHHYRGLKVADKHHIKFPKMRHIRFMAQSVNLLPPQSARNEEDRRDIIKSYEITARYVLRFLDFHLKESGRMVKDLTGSESEQKLYIFR